MFGYRSMQRFYRVVLSAAVAGAQRMAAGPRPSRAWLVRLTRA